MGGGLLEGGGDVCSQGGQGESAHAWEEARKCTVGGAEHDTVWKSRI